jgi:hypothetical protein
MNKSILWPVLAVLVIGLVLIFWPRKVPEPPMPLDLPEPTRASEQPVVPEPVPEPPPAFVAEASPEPEPPLPDLDESDEAARAALIEAAGETLIQQHLVPDSLVRKLVTTVDNLPRDRLWMKVRAVPAVEGRFLVTGTDDEPYLAEENFARYTPFVQLAEAVDVDALAAAYRRYYPLLQQAYEELGYPGRQFHNRAVEVIDHLLATPEVQGPIRLERPHVLYRFADPELEALSGGQKILVRVGPRNAALLRSKLTELRAALEAMSEAPGAGG